MKRTFPLTGICAKEIIVEMDDNGIINKFEVIKGCNGQSKSITAAIEGQHVKSMIIDHFIEKWSNIQCNSSKSKTTSCSAQAIAVIRELRELYTKE